MMEQVNVTLTETIKVLLDDKKVQHFAGYSDYDETV